jgi:hypothetical protein
LHALLADVTHFYFDNNYTGMSQSTSGRLLEEGVRSQITFFLKLERGDHFSSSTCLYMDVENVESNSLAKPGEG